MIDRKTYDITKEIKEVSEQLERIKSDQTSGSSNYVVLTTESIQYSYSASGGLIEPTVTFTADQQLNAFAELNALVRVSGSQIFNYSFEPQKRVSDVDSLVTTWDVNIQQFGGSPAGTLQVTWYVLSFDTGVISG